MKIKKAYVVERKLILTTELQISDNSANLSGSVVSSSWYVRGKPVKHADSMLVTGLLGDRGCEVLGGTIAMGEARLGRDER